MHTLALSTLPNSIRSRSNARCHEIRSSVVALSARDLERLELARDLHDGPLQELYALGHFIDDVMELRADEEVEHIRGSLTRIIEGVRDVCEHRRPHILLHFGLRDAVVHLPRRARSQRPGVSIHDAVTGDFTEVHPRIQNVVYMVCQEAVNNVGRHADAAGVEVRLSRDADEIQLTVRDDGKGFNTGIEDGRCGLGIPGMLERAVSVGGRCAVCTSPGRGTHVSMAEPIHD